MRTASRNLLTKMTRNQQKYEFIDYLATSYRAQASERVPTLTDLSQELGVSVACLREQLEVARALGFVDARPRTGIRRLPYSFTPAVKQSVSYALDLERSHFDTFSDLRNHLETAYWYEAVGALTEQDKNDLKELLALAWAKLRSPQIHIPHAEHRQLHLGIYSRLDNPFVMGILEAYWDAYESVGLNMYAGYDYLQQVWQYHQKMVDDICIGDYEAGYKALIEHKDLLYYHPVAGIMGMDRTETSRSETG